MSNEEITVDIICQNCFRLGHIDEECAEFRIQACTKCYRLNVTTSNCNCKNRKQNYPPQLLRLVGDHIGPLWYIDIKILDKIVNALINTSIKRCRINKQLALWLQSSSNESIDSNCEIRVPIKRKGTTYVIRCQISESQTELLEVGTAFLKYFGYQFTFDGVTISSQQSFIASSSNEIEYAYNVPAIGKDLREYLNKKRKFLKKGRIMKSTNWLQNAVHDDRIVIISQNSDIDSNQDSE